MTSCKFCNADNLEWYQDHLEKWRLGIKIDINNYRKHECIQEKPKNGRNWIKFLCKCGCPVRQNLKLVKTKELNLCLECDNYETKTFL